MITICDRNLIHSSMTTSPAWGNVDNFAALIQQDRAEKESIFHTLAKKLKLS